jgi:DNA-binding NarL/FixJ family response regulator
VPPEAFCTTAGADPEAAAAAATATPVTATPAALLEKGLTARQIDVLRELLEGKSNKQICRDLNLAMGTVKAHVTAVLTVMGVNTRAEAMATADRNGWRVLLTQPPPDPTTPAPTVVPIRSRHRP